MCPPVLEKSLTSPVRAWMTGQGLLSQAEYRAPWGVCDLVGLRFTEAGVSRRIASGQRAPLGSLLRIELLAAILQHSKSSAPMTLARLRDIVDSECARGLEHELVHLERRRLVRRVGRGWSAGDLDWLPLHERIVAVELKLRRVSDALSQARNHVRFASERYVALPQKAAERALLTHGDAFRQAGVGILSVDSRDCAVILGTEAVLQLKHDLYEQVRCVERFWAKRLKDTTACTAPQRGAGV